MCFGRIDDRLKTGVLTIIFRSSEIRQDSRFAKKRYIIINILTEQSCRTRSVEIQKNQTGARDIPTKERSNTNNNNYYITIIGG